MGQVISAALQYLIIMLFHMYFSIFKKLLFDSGSTIFGYWTWPYCSFDNITINCAALGIRDFILNFLLSVCYYILLFAHKSSLVNLFRGGCYDNLYITKHITLLQSVSVLLFLSFFFFFLPYF